MGGEIMNKLINKFSLGIMAAVVTMIGLSNFAQAAADADAASSTALFTTLWSDNKGMVMLFLGGAIVAGILLAVVIKSLNYAGAKIIGAIPGRRRRR